MPPTQPAPTPSQSVVLPATIHSKRCLYHTGMKIVYCRRSDRCRLQTPRSCVYYIIIVFNFYAAIFSLFKESKTIRESVPCEKRKNYLFSCWCVCVRFLLRCCLCFGVVSALKKHFPIKAITNKPASQTDGHHVYICCWWAHQHLSAPNLNS